MPPPARRASTASPGPEPRLPDLRLKVRVTGRHPHFFRKMVRKPETALPAGSAVFVRDREGRPVGTGFYNPRTELALRMLSREPVLDPGRELLARLADACELRDHRLALPEVTDAYRLVHAEGDGLPGLVIDRLGPAIVAQVFALCVMPHMEAIGQQLLARYRGARLSLSVDQEAARREGIDKLPHSRPAGPVTITEHGLRYVVHPGSLHKTGFYADQRDNRQRVRHLARGRRLLDLFCNTGGFALAALAGGAEEVLAVDLDEAVLAQAAVNAAANAEPFADPDPRGGSRAKTRGDHKAGSPARTRASSRARATTGGSDRRLSFEHGDAFEILRQARPGRHDMIVLDPPKWARGKGEVDAALEKYRDLNRLAFEKLPAGGLLVTCSCSGAVAEARFTAVVAEAAAQAGRDARILHAGGAGPDHPVALECPETRYLKVLVLELR